LEEIDRNAVFSMDWLLELLGYVEDEKEIINPKEQSILYPWQIDILKQVESHFLTNEIGVLRIAITGAPHTGKTTLAAIINLYVLLGAALCHEKATIRAISIDFDQLLRAFFREVMELFNKLPSCIRKLFNCTKESIAVINDPLGNAIEPRAWDINRPHSIAGRHSPLTLFTIDEANCIPDEIYESVRAITQESVAVVFAIGNPRYHVGWFYEIFENNPTEWMNRMIAYKDAHPNDVLYEQELISAYGKDSDEYRWMYLGRFPTITSNRFFYEDIITAFVNRIPPQIQYNPKDIRIAVDVSSGESADFSAMTVRTSSKILQIYRKKIKPEDFLPEILDTARKYGTDRVAIDGTGVGLGLADQLEKQLRVFRVSAGTRANNEFRFKNRITELAYHAREWMRLSGSINLREIGTNGGILIDELRQMDKDSSDKLDRRLKLNKKGNTKAKKSPDTADSFIMTFAIPDEVYNSTRQYQTGFSNYGY